MPRDGDLTPGLDDMWLSPSEIAEARLPGLPSTRGRVREMAERLGWTAPEREGAAWRQRVGRGGGVEINARCLPLAAQAKLLRHMPEAPLPAGPSQEADAAVAERWAWFDRQPERLKAKARARMKIMMRLRELLGAHRSRAYAIGLLLQEHRHDKGADAPKLSKSTIYEWEKLVGGRSVHDWMPFLAPAHGGGRQKADCDPEALRFLLSDWMRPEAPNFSSCYRRLAAQAAAKGWVIPSERTLLRQAMALPEGVRILKRQGEEALKRSLPAQRRDRGVFHALEAVNADGHAWDVFVRWPDGTIGRPVMCAFTDTPRRGPTSKHAQIRMVHAVWAEICKLGALTRASGAGAGHDDADDHAAALRAFCARQTRTAANPQGVSAPEFLDSVQANRVLEGLKAWRKRLRHAATGGVAA